MISNTVKMKRTYILAFTLLLSCLFSVHAAYPDDFDKALDAGAVLPGHVIFKITEAAAEKTEDPMSLPAHLRDLLSNHGVRSTHRVFPYHNAPVEKYHSSGLALVDLSRIFETVVDDAERMKGVMYALASSGLTDYVQARPVPRLLNPEFKTDTSAYHPNDPLTDQQYYLDNIAAYEAWAVTRGDTNYMVGIVDTGVELDHPDLVDAIAYNYDDPINGEDSDNDGYVDNFYGWDLGEGNNDPSINNSAHGIHVSGIAAAMTNNHEGIAGVGYHTRFLPVKIDDELGRLIKAYEGIVYAADQGVDVVNCSWGSHFNAGPFGQDIINYAVLNNDVLVIAAAGNADDDVPFYPASFDHVVSVAATDSLDHKAGFSSYGPFIDIAAPGHQVMSTWVNGSYMRGNGTSMASPVVAGAAALLRSYYPDISALQTAALLRMTADPIDHLEGNTDYASQLGYGRLNMYRSLTETTHSYIRIAEHVTDPAELGNAGPGTEFELKMHMQNMLAPANSVLALMTTASENLEVLTDTVSFGSVDSLLVFDNFLQPFQVYARPDLPENYTALFAVHFFDEEGNIIGREFFQRVLNREYINIEAGPIKTTISALGAVGFNYPDYSQGWGLTYDGSYTVLRNGGIVLANSPAETVDNVYGSEKGTFSEKLFAEQHPVIHTDHLLAPIVVSGRLTENIDQVSTPLDLAISYDYYFWDYDDPKDYFILHYHVVNQSEATYSHLYAGFFADWILRNNKLHRATIDIPSRVAYAYSDEGGHYTGIQLLSDGGMRHYAFDNQGAKGSMRIDNGFSDVQKYAALTTNRLQAGYFAADNDISSMISHGPHTLHPGDTLSFGFALHFADELDDLRDHATEAKIFYDALEDLETSISEPACEIATDPMQVYPNPFADKMNVRFGIEMEGTYTLSLYGSDGRLKLSRKINLVPGQVKTIEKNLSDLAPGLYLLSLQGRDVNHSQIIIRE